jgi:hypothetical protein
VTATIPAEVQRFRDYFNVADEIYSGIQAGIKQDEVTHSGPLNLADINVRLVRSARKAATEQHLPWPPYLPAAEEFCLSNPEFVRGEANW